MVTVTGNAGRPPDAPRFRAAGSRNPREFWREPPTGTTPTRPSPALPDGHPYTYRLAGEGEEAATPLLDGKHRQVPFPDGVSASNPQEGRETETGNAAGRTPVTTVHEAIGRKLARSHGGTPSTRPGAGPGIHRISRTAPSTIANARIVMTVGHARRALSDRGPHRVPATPYA